MLLAPLLFFPIFLFSGPFSVNIPTGLGLIEYLVFFKYSILLMLNNECEAPAAAPPLQFTSEDVSEAKIRGLFPHPDLPHRQGARAKQMATAASYGPD